MRQLGAVRPVLNVEHKPFSALVDCGHGRCGPDGARSSDLFLEKVGCWDFYRKFLNCQML